MKANFAIPILIGFVVLEIANADVTCQGKLNSLDTECKKLKKKYDDNVNELKQATMADQAELLLCFFAMAAMIWLSKQKAAENQSLVKELEKAKLRLKNLKKELQTARTEEESWKKSAEFLKSVLGLFTDGLMSSKEQLSLERQEHLEALQLCWERIKTQGKITQDQLQSALKLRYFLEENNLTEMTQWLKGIEATKDGKYSKYYSYTSFTDRNYSYVHF